MKLTDPSCSTFSVNQDLVVSRTDNIRPHFLECSLMAASQFTGLRTQKKLDDNLCCSRSFKVIHSLKIEFACSAVEHFQSNQQFCLSSACGDINANIILQSENGKFKTWKHHKSEVLGLRSDENYVTVQRQHTTVVFVIYCVSSEVTQNIT